MKTLKKIACLLTEVMVLYALIEYFVLDIYAFRDSFATGAIFSALGVIAYILGSIVRYYRKPKRPTKLSTRTELVKEYSHVAWLRESVMIALLVIYVISLGLLSYKTYAGDRTPLDEFKADVQCINELTDEETIQTKYLWLFGALPTPQFNQTAYVVRNMRILLEDVTLVAEAVENADSVDDAYLSELKAKVQEDQKLVTADTAVSEKATKLNTFFLYFLWFIVGSLKVFIEDALRYHTKMREIERSNA